MAYSKKENKKIERVARLMIWMATKSSRNHSVTDKLCRLILNKATTSSPKDDFMRDSFVDNDKGFDPDELERFQRGENNWPR